MKKQLKLLFFVAILVTLVVMTMVVASAAGEYQYVAEDGSTANANTLADAVANAKADSTITVLASVTETTPVTIDKNLTIVGTEGATITVKVADENSWITVNSGKEFTMIAVNAVRDASVYPLAFIDVAGGTATVKNCVLDNYYYDGSKHATTAAHNGSIGAVLRISAAGSVANAINCEMDGYNVFVLAAQGTLNVDGGRYHAKGLVADKTPADYNESTNATSSAEGRVVLAMTTSTGSIINVFDGELKGGRTAVILQAQATLNVYGGTLIHTHSSNTGGTIYLRNDKAVANIYGGTVKPLINAAVYIYSSGGKVSVYGGTIVNTQSNSKGALFRFKNKGTLTFVNAGTEYTYTKPDGTVVTKTSEGATLENHGSTFASGNGAIFANSNIKSTIKLGNGLKIKLFDNGSLGTITGTTPTIGEVSWYSYNGDLPADFDWSKATFYINPTEVVIAPGTYNIDSMDAAMRLAATFDATMKAWGKEFEAAYFLDGAVPGLTVGEGVTLNFQAGEDNVYDALLPGFLDIQGGTVNIESGIFKAAAGYTIDDAIIFLQSGTLNIQGADTRFELIESSAGFIIKVSGGTLNIACDSSNHIPAIHDFENDYRASDAITDANFIVDEGTGIIRVTSKNASITVEDGVFLKRGISADGTAATGFIFDFTSGGYTEAITTTLTIKKGYFYSPCIVRVTTTAQDAEGNLLQGVTVNIQGGTFVGNAALETSQSYSRMFLFNSNGGKNKLNITNNVTVYASKWEMSVIYVPASKPNNGSEFNVLGGTYNFGNNFITVNRSASNVTLYLKDATLNQLEFDTSVLEGAKDAADASKSATPYVIYMGGTNSGSVSHTLENVTITARNAAVFGVYGSNRHLTIISGTFIGDQIVDKNDAGSTALGTLDIQGGTFVQTGEHASVFYHQTAKVSGKALVLAPAGTAVYYVFDAETETYVAKAFDVYSPVVKLAGTEYKFWTALEATEVGAPVISTGAGIYLGANGLGDNKENCGIRFNSVYTDGLLPEGYVWLPDEDEDGNFVSNLGTLIAPADYVAAAIAKGGKFTHKDLEALGNEVPYLDIPVSYEVWEYGYDEETETYSFAAAIYNLNSDERAYAAVAYVLALNEETGEYEYFYGAYDAIDNSRSAKQVANYYYDTNNFYYNQIPVMKEYYAPAPTAPEQGEE